MSLDFSSSPPKPLFAVILALLAPVDIIGLLLQL